VPGPIHGRVHIGRSLPVVSSGADSGGAAAAADDTNTTPTGEVGGARMFAVDDVPIGPVGRCRLTVSTPVLKAPTLSA